MRCKGDERATAAGERVADTRALDDAKKEAEKAQKETAKLKKDAEKAAEKAAEQAKKEAEKLKKEGAKAAERAAAQAKKEAEKEAEKAAKAVEKEMAGLRKLKQEARRRRAHRHGPLRPIPTPLMRRPAPAFGVAGGSSGCQDAWQERGYSGDAGRA